MQTLDTVHPGYGFAAHKGYPVLAHYVLAHYAALPGLARALPTDDRSRTGGSWLAAVAPLARGIGSQRSSRNAAIQKRFLKTRKFSAFDLC